MNVQSPEYGVRTKEIVVKINSGIQKTNSTYGNYIVYADAHFDKEGKTWDYPNKGYYFFTKKMAKYFIENYLTMSF